MFFARLLGYAHDAMEHLFDDVAGGYATLIVGRGIGFPAVHVTSDFKAPIRYGDAAVIGVTVTKLGATSCHMRFVFTRASDGVAIATTSHVHVCTTLATMTKLPIPNDVSAALEQHLAP